MISELQNYYETQPEPQRGCLLALREIILKFDPEIKEAWKWRMPIFMYKKRMFCHLWLDRKAQLYVAISGGSDIKHSALKTFNNAKIPKLPVDPTKDLPIKLIQEILELARSRHHGKYGKPS